MSHTHEMIDSDTRFIFDPITNKLSTASKKRTLAQYSHEREIFSFELPRYIEGHDMSLCNEREVHYTNTDTKTKEKNEDVYEPAELIIVGDKVVFAWLIRNTVTGLAGSLEFSIKLKCTGENGELLYELDSVPYTKISITAGMNNSAKAIERTPDLLASFKAQVLSEANAAITEAETAAGRATEQAGIATSAAEEAEGYKDDASASARAASGSEAEALISEHTAADAAAAAIEAKTAAERAERNATASSEYAIAQANAAASSAASAGSSKAQAVESAAQAKASKEAAAASASGLEALEESARNSAINAQGSSEAAAGNAQLAQASQIAASKSETAARQSEVDAENAKDSAAASAQIATQKATDAEGAAESAAESAAAANLDRQKAETARDEAEEAEVSALDAADRAEFAAEEAENCANAIIGVVSGAVIRVDDVSPLEHNVGLRVHSKNMIPAFPVDKSVTRDELTQTVSAGGQTITLNGTTASTGCGRTFFASIATPILLKKGKTYTLSHSIVSGTATDIYSVYLSKFGDNAAIASLNSYTPSKTFTPTKDVEVYIGINTQIGETYNNLVVRFMLEEGDTASAYEPWIDPTSMTVTRCGKNILPYPYPASVITTKSGITITDDGKGTLTINGTAEVTVTFNLLASGINVKGKYTLSGMTGGSGVTYYIQPFVNGVSYGGMTDGYRAYEFPEGELAQIKLTVVGGTTVTNLKCKLMLEVGDTASEHELYSGVSYTPDVEGVVEGVRSLSPTMTICTDTAGAVIECEYNRDINKAIEGIREDIKTLDSDLTVVKESIGGGGEGGSGYILTEADKEEIANIVLNSLPNGDEVSY